MFFLPDFRSLREARVSRAKRAIDRKVAWQDADLTKRKDVGIIAKTFTPENPLDEVFPDVPSEGITYKDRLRYAKIPLPVHEGLPFNAAADLYSDSNRVYFDEEVPIPALHYKLEPDERPWEHYRWATWMSLTPMEMWTQRSGIQAATGRVILGGLGMGWLMRQIAKKPTVKEIIVIEKDQDIVDWFGTTICKNTPKCTGLLVGDFWERAREFDLAKDRFIADIWPTLGDAQSDRNLAKLRATGAKVWAWGSARPDHYQQMLINQEKKK